MDETWYWTGVMFIFILVGIYYFDELTKQDGDDMADRESVIKGLNCCKHTDGVECPNCPYCQDCDCVEDMVTDVLKLLKEQEDEIKELRSMVEFWKEKALHT